MTEFKSFNMYHSYLDGISLLSDEERGRLFTALLRYSALGEETELTGSERFIYPLMRSQIDRDRESFREKSRRNSENGRKGALAKINAQRLAAEGLSSAEPSFDEVSEYCAQHGLSVDPRRFYNYFSAGKWRDSHGNKVYNWQQKLLTWNLYESRVPPEAAAAEERKIDFEELKRSIDKI